MTHILVEAMKLPQTREEFVVWALEYSSKERFNVYDYLGVSQKRMLPYYVINEATNKINSWVERTLEQFPEFVTVDIYEPNIQGGSRINVWIVCVLGIRCSIITHDPENEYACKLERIYQEQQHETS